MSDPAGVQGEVPFGQRASTRTRRCAWEPSGSVLLECLTSAGPSWDNAERATPVCRPMGAGRGPRGFRADRGGQQDIVRDPAFRRQSGGGGDSLVRLRERGQFFRMLGAVRRA